MSLSAEEERREHLSSSTHVNTLASIDNLVRRGEKTAMNDITYHTKDSRGIPPTSDRFFPPPPPPGPHQPPPGACFDDYSGEGGGVAIKSAWAKDNRLKSRGASISFEQCQTSQSSSRTKESISKNHTKMTDTTDWISAVFAILATVVGFATLVTVYIGAMQFLSQSRIYRAGLSWRSLGPWQSKVARSRLLGLQRRIITPSISSKMLVRQKWTPNLTFPVGFSRYQSIEGADSFQANASWVNFLQGVGFSPKDNDRHGMQDPLELIDGVVPTRWNPAGFSRYKSIEDADNIQAKASWVNFLQSLGVTPEDNNLYEMQDASELINGVVPMRWTGQDLVGICSILGFQSYESSPSFLEPMPLPMQWISPIGWLQFRPSDNGCIVEFRRRMDQPNQIQDNFGEVRLPKDPLLLQSRLWNSIGGLLLSDDRALYLGAFMDDSQEEDNLNPDQSDIYEQLMSRDLSTEEILGKLFDKRKPESKRYAVKREET